jgi:hypothetical protein
MNRTWKIVGYAAPAIGAVVSLVTGYWAAAAWATLSLMWYHLYVSDKEAP